MHYIEPLVGWKPVEVMLLGVLALANESLVMCPQLAIFFVTLILVIT